MSNSCSDGLGGNLKQLTVVEFNQRRRLKAGQWFQIKWSGWIWWLFKSIVSGVGSISLKFQACKLKWKGQRSKGYYSFHHFHIRQTIWLLPVLHLGQLKVFKTNTCPHIQAFVITSNCRKAKVKLLTCSHRIHPPISISCRSLHSQPHGCLHNVYASNITLSLHIWFTWVLILSDGMPCSMMTSAMGIICEVHGKWGHVPNSESETFDSKHMCHIQRRCA